MRQCIFLGRAGSDGELRFTQNGTPVFSFSLAVSEKRQDATETHWFNIVVWAKSAEIAKEQVRKGCEVMVIGKAQSRSYTDKENKRVEKVDFVAERIRVTAYKKGETHGTSSEPPETSFGGDMNDSDVPF